MRIFGIVFLTLLFLSSNVFCGNRAKAASLRLYEEALAAARNGDFKLAQAKAQKSVKKDPNNAEAKEFLKDFDHMCHFPDVHHASHSLYREAFDAFLKNDLITAEQKAEACLAIEPENPEARRMLDRLRSGQVTK